MPAGAVSFGSAPAASSKRGRREVAAAGREQQRREPALVDGDDGAGRAGAGGPRDHHRRTRDRAWASAPASSRTSTTPACRCDTAHIRAVCPSVASRACASAPRASRAATASALPVRGGGHERGLAARQGGVGRGARPQQRPDQRGVAVLAGEIERRGAEVVRGNPPPRPRRSTGAPSRDRRDRRPSAEPSPHRAAPRSRRPIPPAAPAPRGGRLRGPHQGGGDRAAGPRRAPTAPRPDTRRAEGCGGRTAGAPGGSVDVKCRPSSVHSRWWLREARPRALGRQAEPQDGDSRAGRGPPARMGTHRAPPPSRAWKVTGSARASGAHAHLPRALASPTCRGTIGGSIPA